MDHHLLFELAYVLHKICTSIVHGERGLMEMPGELCLFYSLSKGGLRNLAQSFLHDISSYTPSQMDLFASSCETIPPHRNRIH